MEPQPAPIFDISNSTAINSNYYYASMMSSFHHSATSYEFLVSGRMRRSDFDNSVIHGDEKIFDKLYNYGHNHENKRLKYKWTPIMIASWSMNSVFFNHLLNNYNIDLDLKNDSGHTVLHIVCIRKAVEFINILIKHGAHIDIKDDYGYTPLDYLHNYPINIDEIKELYKTEQKWIRRKFLFLIQRYIKKCSKLADSGKKVLQDMDILRYISSFL